MTQDFATFLTEQCVFRLHGDECGSYNRVQDFMAVDLAEGLDKNSVDDVTYLLFQQQEVLMYGVVDANGKRDLYNVRHARSFF